MTMSAILRTLLLSAVLVVASASNCSIITDPVSCVEHESLLAHTCVFCASDNLCHAVASPENPCTVGCCASKSALSNCDYNTVTEIPPTCYASNEPQQIHMAFAGTTAKGNPAGMAFNWFTSFSTVSSTIQFDTTKNLGSSAAGVSHQYLPEYGYHHTVTLPTLSPATRYYYRVGDAAAGFSDIFSFVTAADTYDDGYSVAVYGDMGYLDSEERPLIIPAVIVKNNWTAVPVRELLEGMKDEIDWMLLLGDIGYADDAFAHQRQFAYETINNGYMNWMQNLSSVMPWMVTPGNHEVECHSPICIAESDKYGTYLQNFTAFNARWSMPSVSSAGVANMWYSYNVGPIHWVSLNTETDFPGAQEENDGGSAGFPAGHFAANGTYLRWLEADLKAASEDPNRPWIIAYGHRPIASEIKATVTPLFQKYGVELYISGHQHSYARSGPVGPNSQLDKKSMLSDDHYHAAEGTTFIIAGTAGCDEMDYVTDPETLEVSAFKRNKSVKDALPEGSIVKTVSSDKVSAAKLKIHNSTAIEWTLYEGGTGTILDHFWLTK